MITEERIKELREYHKNKIIKELRENNKYNWNDEKIISFAELCSKMLIID